MTARSNSAPASSPSSALPAPARPASLSVSPAISPRALTRSIWRAWRPKCSVARAAAGAPTWRRPADLMAPRLRRRLRLSNKRWLASSPPAILPRQGRLNARALRGRLYELLAHDHQPYSAGSRFVRLIVSIIIIAVLAIILALGAQAALADEPAADN